MDLRDFSSLPDEAFVKSATVMVLFGISGKGTLLRWERSGRIPKSVRFGDSRIRFWNIGALRRFAAETSRAA